MLFQHVIGQFATKAALRQMAGGERLPHALLLLGPTGSGSLPLALAVAQYVLCEQRTPEDACGQCPACLKTGKLIHPDVHFSFPTIGANATSEGFYSQWRSALEHNPWLDVNDWLQNIGAENKQGNITKEECVNIIRKFSLKTFEAKHKILIQWLPEYLGKEGNRLLKLIEEPPDATVFILVTENPTLILNTILSRCQLVKVNALSDADVSGALVARRGLAADQAQAIAQLAYGNYNDALKMAASDESDQAHRFLDWMRRCYKGIPAEMVEWSEAFAGEGRENQKHFLRYALHFWREFLMLKAVGEHAVRLREREKQTAIGMAKVMGMEQLEAIVTCLDECSYHVERNAHPKVLFLDVSIRIHHIIKNWSAYQARQQKRATAAG